MEKCYNPTNVKILSIIAEEVTGLKKNNAKLIVLLGIIFMSLSAIITKSSKAPAFIIAGYRLAFTTLLLLPFIITKKRKELMSLDKKAVGICMISGIFLALHFATWIYSIKYTSVASSTALVNTHPIFVVIGTFFIFKEKISRKVVFSILLTLAGSIIISSGDSSLGSNIIFGDAIALLGSLFMAGYMMIGSTVRKRVSATSYTFIVYFSSTIVLLILSLLTKTPLYPYPPRELLLFLALAVFCTILGHSIINWALKYIKPTFISTAFLGVPILSSIWSIFIFNEIPSKWQITGGLVILYGIYSFIKIKENDSIESKN